MSTEQPLLSVDDLSVTFRTDHGVVPAVRDFSYTLDAGETLAIVGESGSGKSVGALAVMRLIPDPPGRISDGTIRFGDRSLLTLPESEMQRIRGNEIAMIFQEPMTSLNPVLTVAEQIVEAVQLHQDLNKQDARARALEMLELVQITEPEQRLDQYPHELSGGMCQRVMIAMAMACTPSILIADEPTTALDVTIQAQILELIHQARDEYGMSVIFITHDLGVVAEMADRVAVMYAGEIVEESEVDNLFANPKHPYTQGLIGSIPVLGQHKAELDTIPGVVPRLIDLGEGCRFAGRCEARVEAGLTICASQRPDLIEIESGHKVRCWLYQDHEESVDG